jgi:hypothetical protein
MKAAATLLVRLPPWAGRRRLSAITPPQLAGRSRRHTHILRDELTCLKSSSDWIHLASSLIVAYRAEMASCNGTMSPMRPKRYDIVPFLAYHLVNDR